jgi:hypothetical protein
MAQRVTAVILALLRKFTESPRPLAESLATTIMATFAPLALTQHFLQYKFVPLVSGYLAEREVQGHGLEQHFHKTASCYKILDSQKMLEFIGP